MGLEQKKKEYILVTGACGFIGYHLCKYLLNKSFEVIGIDNLSDYYDCILKEERLSLLKKFNKFVFYKIDLKEESLVREIFNIYKPHYVVNLAAQAGVRYSIDNPHAYVDSNIVGFINILEACRNYPVKHLLYASSSSVYGGNKKVPFSTNDNVDHPISFYAATKKANELMAHTYSHLYNIPTSGLRFFTVYGPWGRPDMAYFSFTKNIIEGKPIKIFNQGKMERDFTYIDDIIISIYRLLTVIPKNNPEWSEKRDSINTSFAPYKIYNIGNNNSVQLLKFIKILEEKIGRRAEKIFLDMQPGDIIKTYADISELEKVIGFKPKTNIEDGLGRFVDWYISYYNHNH